MADRKTLSQKLDLEPGFSSTSQLHLIIIEATQLQFKKMLLL